MKTRAAYIPECYSVLIVGPNNAGKTTLFKKLLSKSKSDKDSEVTVSSYQGGSSASSYVTNVANNIRVECQYHDINPAKGPIQHHYHNPTVIFAVFDITDGESLNQAHDNGVQAMEQYRKYNPLCLYIGAKSDLSNELHLSNNDITSKIQGNGGFLKVGADHDTCIDTLLRIINQTIIDAECVRIANETRRIAEENRRAEENTRIANLPENKILGFINISPNQTLKDQLVLFLQQTSDLKVKEPTKIDLITECQQAVVQALNGENLANLHRVASSLSNTKQLKALAICMMAVGTVLAIVGALAIAVSMGAIATGVLAPLGVLTLGGGAAMTALGAASIIGGAGLFAARHKLFNPIDSINKIEHSLKTINLK